MKHAISKCFSIVLFTITIFSMAMMILCGADTLPIFLGFGKFIIFLIAFTIGGIWLSCATILFIATKETIKAGEGLSKLFQTFIGKISKNA